MPRKTSEEPLYRNVIPFKVEGEKQQPFTQVDLRIIRSRHLSEGAKSVYVYILGMKTDWNFSSERMNQHFKCCSKTLRKYIKELISLCLIDRINLLSGHINYKTRPFEQSALPDDELL